MSNMSIHQAPKYPKVPNLKIHTYKSLLKNHPTQFFVCTLVLNVHYCTTCFCPEKHKKILVMNHHLLSPNDGLIFPLCNPILLRVVRHYQLLPHSCIYTKKLEVLGGVLSPIV